MAGFQWTPTRVLRMATTAMVSCGLVGLGFAAGIPPASAAPALNAYVSQPFVQGPYVPGVEIETFDADCPDTWWSTSGIKGSMTGSCTSMNGDIWGGASSISGAPSLGDGSSQTKYGAVFVGSSMTVTLDQPVSYMGFHWEAGDSSNFITLYLNGVEVASFSTQDLMNMLYYDDVGSWSANDYLINPARDEWIGAPFAYIHLVGVGGLTFDSFTMTQPYYGGFEFDNFALRQAPVTIDLDEVVAIGDETPPDANENGIDDTTEDSDGDGISDPFEDTNHDGSADVLQDTDHDGINDYAESVMLPDTGKTSGWPVALVSVSLIIAGAVLVILRRRFPS